MNVDYEKNLNLKYSLPVIAKAFLYYYIDNFCDKEDFMKLLTRVNLLNSNSFEPIFIETPEFLSDYGIYGFHSNLTVDSNLNIVGSSIMSVSYKFIDLFVYSNFNDDILFYYFDKWHDRNISSMSVNVEVDCDLSEFDLVYYLYAYCDLNYKIDFQNHDVIIISFLPNLKKNFKEAEIVYLRETSASNRETSESNQYISENHQLTSESNTNLFSLFHPGYELDMINTLPPILASYVNSYTINIYFYTNLVNSHVKSNNMDFSILLYDDDSFKQLLSLDKVLNDKYVFVELYLSFDWINTDFFENLFKLKPKSDNIILCLYDSTDEQYQYILANKDKLYDKYKGIVFLKK